MISRPQKLKNGPGSMRNNMEVLLGAVESNTRHKAILTLAKRKGISYEEAQQYQATRIAQSRLAK